jgi:predicted ArsR family transcriptional regulator
MTMTKSTFWDIPRPGDYRATDPVTSRKAASANEVARATQKKQILGRLLSMDFVTSHDVADICSGQNGTASKRLGEMEKAGLIERCGFEYGPRRGGTPRFRYRLTTDGRRDAELTTQGAGFVRSGPDESNRT